MNGVSSLVWIDSTGYHYEDYPTFLAWVQGQYQGIYGADVYLGADSQDGQWTAVLAQALYDTASLGAQTYNSFSPNTAQGVGLSSNVQINGLQRVVPTNSTVILTIIGVGGTVITNGIATDNLNQQWDLPGTVTVPSGGLINVTATAQNPGAVAAVPDSVINIFTPTLGWQSVNNASAAVVGTAVESDAALRIRQRVSTSNPSLTILAGTAGAIANLPGVQQVQPYENYTDTTDANGLPPHSFCMVVLGGDVDAIAAAMMQHKTPGANPFAPGGAGFQSILVFDSNGMPVNIQFYSPPDTATVAVELTLAALDGWTTAYESQIQDAVANAINSLGIGDPVLITQLYIPAYLVGTPAYGTYDITGLEINLNGGGFSSTNIDIAFNAVAVCGSVSITVS